MSEDLSSRAWQEDKTPFHCEGHQTSEQIIQRGCVVSILGHSQALSGQSPERPVITLQVVLLWARTWTWDTLRFLPKLVILRCNLLPVSPWWRWGINTNVEDVPAVPSVGLRRWKERWQCLYIKNFFISSIFAVQSHPV